MFILSRCWDLRFGLDMLKPIAGNSLIYGWIWSQVMSVHHSAESQLLFTLWERRLPLKSLEVGSQQQSVSGARGWWKQPGPSRWEALRNASEERITKRMKMRCWPFLDHIEREGEKDIERLKWFGIAHCLIKFRKTLRSTSLRMFLSVPSALRGNERQIWGPSK